MKTVISSSSNDKRRPRATRNFERLIKMYYIFYLFSIFVYLAALHKKIIATRTSMSKLITTGLENK